MSNDILSPDYSQLLRVFVSGTEMLMRAWLEQLQPSVLCNCCFPSVVTVLMTHRLFCCKVNQGVIPLGLGSFGFSGEQEITISCQPFVFHQDYGPIVIGPL